LGIVFGVAAVISMLAIAEGTSSVAREQIRALGRHQHQWFARPSRVTKAQATGGRPSRILNYGLKYSDFDGWSRRSPRSRRSCRCEKSASKIRHNHYALDGRVVGTTQDYAEFNCSGLRKGGFLTASGQ